MDEDAGQVGGGAERSERSPEEIRQEIARTRAELGETVAALAEKTDVKAQARRKLDEVRGTVAEKKDEALKKAEGMTSGGGTTYPPGPRRSPVPALAMGIAAGIALLAVIRRRKR